MKALALISGGLDSSLAAKLILEQGVEVEGINFISLFWLYRQRPNLDYAQRIAQQLGIELKTMDISEELLELAKSPKHGRGSGLNPCIDCRILMFKKAKQYLNECKAEFLITGEVLGQRPFSQNRETLKLIDREAELEGLVLRPLSAKLLASSLPEEKGWVDRKRLSALNGRTRKKQLSLAGEYNISGYSTPAGGCLLTDSVFSQRLKRLLKYSLVNRDDVELLKKGRHFRLADNLRLVVARDEKECKAIEELLRPGDVLFRPLNIKGPLALARGIIEDSCLKVACSVLARYCNNWEDKVQIEYLKVPDEEGQIVLAEPLSQERIEKYRIYP